MKKKNLLFLGAALLAVTAMAACNNSSSGESKATESGGTSQTQQTTTNKQEENTPDYAASYAISYEDEEGNTKMASPERTPITNSSVLSAYGTAFGSFVDKVTASATLDIDEATMTYTYVWKCECGTEGENGYFPTFTFKGNVVYKTDNVVQVSAPTYAEEVITSYGQFVTNEEMIGYFGTTGTVTKSTDTSAAPTQVLYGEKLLAVMSGGTFIMKDKEILAFGQGTAYVSETTISGEDAEGNTVMTAVTNAPFESQSLLNAYGNSFGSFVEEVKARATLLVNGDKYCYVYECLCGVAGESGYFPTFAWWGDCTASDEGIQISTPTYGMSVINAYGQFATNAEQTGYFGEVGTVVTSKDTSNTYDYAIYGETLLTTVLEGVFTVEDGEIKTFTAKSAEKKEDDTPADTRVSIFTANNTSYSAFPVTLDFYSDGNAKVTLVSYGAAYSNITVDLVNATITGTDVDATSTVTKGEDGSYTIHYVNAATTALSADFVISATDAAKVKNIVVAGADASFPTTLRVFGNGTCLFTLTAYGATEEFTIDFTNCTASNGSTVTKNEDGSYTIHFVYTASASLTADFTITAAQFASLA